MPKTSLRITKNATAIRAGVPSPASRLGRSTEPVSSIFSSIFASFYSST